MNAEDNDRLLADFEAGRVDPAGFPHERHVQVSWALSRRYPADEALRRLEAGLRRITARAGQPARFHRTITRAWFELVAQADVLERHPELLDKRLLRRYYTPARLTAGRDTWLEPDRRPLQLDSAAADT